MGGQKSSKIVGHHLCTFSKYGTLDRVIRVFMKLKILKFKDPVTEMPHPVLECLIWFENSISGLECFILF